MQKMRCPFLVVHGADDEQVPLKDAQSQMGHSKLSTTFEIYTVPLPEHQREAVENLARLVTNGDELPKAAPEPQLLTEQIQ